jgi:hypothetical protein
MNMHVDVREFTPTCCVTSFPGRRATRVVGKRVLADSRPRRRAASLRCCAAALCFRALHFLSICRKLRHLSGGGIMWPTLTIAEAAAGAGSFATLPVSNRRHWQERSTKHGNGLAAASPFALAAPANPIICTAARW